MVLRCIEVLVKRRFGGSQSGGIIGIEYTNIIVETKPALAWPYKDNGWKEIVENDDALSPRLITRNVNWRSV